MAFSCKLVLFILLSFASAREENNLQDMNSFVNCLADAVVLEGYLLRSAAELATGIFIPSAMKDLKHFWSLLPEWTTTCKGIFSSKSEISEESQQLLAELEQLMSQEFPALTSVDLMKLKTSLMKSGRFKGMEQVNVPQDCLEGFLFSVKQVFLVSQALNREEFEEASRIMSSLSFVSSSVLKSCQ
jgi:hypothetical protein